MTDEQMINLLQLGMNSDFVTVDGEPADQTENYDRDDLIDDGRGDGYGESYAERNR